MTKNTASNPCRAILTLTVEGRLALVAYALAAAEKTRSKQRRKRLCEEAMSHLRSVVQAQE